MITQYKYDAPEHKEEEGPKHAPIECDEDWDDTDVNDYDPRKYVESANVIRKPEGSNPTIRKTFIKQERKRLGDGDEEDDEGNADAKNNIAQYPPPPLYFNRGDSVSDEEDYAGRPKVDKSLKNCYRYDTTSTVHSSRSDWQDAPSSSNASGGRRKKRWSSPVTTSTAKRNSRSPGNGSNRDRSRSPNTRSYRASPDYSRRYSPPPNAVRHTLDAYNPDDDPYYNGGVGANSFSSSRAYYDRPSETSTTQPPLPPPPMISYPAPRSYLSARNRPSDY